MLKNIVNLKLWKGSNELKVTYEDQNMIIVEKENLEFSTFRIRKNSDPTLTDYVLSY